MTRVASKGADFFKRNLDRYDAWIYHNLWSDGRKEECTRTCQHFSNADCSGLFLGLTMMGIPTGTAGLVLVGGAAAEVLGECNDWIRNKCAAELCIH